MIPGSTTSDGARFGPDESIAIVKQTDPNEGSILVTDAPGIVRPVSQTQWFSKIVQKSPD